MIKFHNPFVEIRSKIGGIKPSSLMDKDIPSYVGDLIPSIATYNQAINNYKRGIKAGDFYEEPIGEDFRYPDW